MIKRRVFLKQVAQNMVYIYPHTPLCIFSNLYSMLRPFRCRLKRSSRNYLPMPTATQV